MFRRFYIQKVLCSEGSMFRRSYIQKVLCSEGPVFRKKLFKSSYIQKVLCSEGPIFRYIQKILYSENSLFYVEKTYIFYFQVNCHQDNKSQPLISAHSVKGQMSFCHGVLSVVCPSTICQNRYWHFNQHSEQPQIRSDHRRSVPLIQEYDTPVDLYCGEPPWPRGSVLGLRPPGLEFRILCLEDSVISFISSSSGGSPGPV